MHGAGEVNIKTMIDDDESLYRRSIKALKMEFVVIFTVKQIKKVLK